MALIGERFWSKVRRGGGGECWPWLASKTGPGYGQFFLSGRLRLAHRVSYEALVGPIPQDYSWTTCAAIGRA